MPLLRLLLVGLVAVLLGAPATALAQQGALFGIGTITDNLGASGVAVDPDAELPVAQVRRLERAVARLRAEEIPADVVVLDQQALGASTFATEVHRARGYDGIQVVIVQRPRSISFAAPGVYDFQDGHIELVDQAARMLADDPVAAAVTRARAGRSSSPRPGPTRSGPGAAPGTTATRWARSRGRSGSSGPWSSSRRSSCAAAGAGAPQGRRAPGA